MGAEPLAREEHDGPRPANDPILAAIAQGDARGAVALCAHEHGAAIGRLCMAWLGTQAEAEEAAQETLLAAFDALAGFRGDGTVRAWLFGIARRVCARRAETSVRREAKLRLVRAEPPDAPGADALLATRRRAQQVRDALGRLKPSERDAVLLRFDAELSFREVAEACGIEEAAARKRVSRALERLREALVED